MIVVREMLCFSKLGEISWQLILELNFWLVQNTIWLLGNSDTRWIFIIHTRVFDDMYSKTRGPFNNKDKSNFGKGFVISASPYNECNNFLIKVNLY